MLELWELHLVGGIDKGLSWTHLPSSLTLLTNLLCSLTFVAYSQVVVYDVIHDSLQITVH